MPQQAAECFGDEILLNVAHGEFLYVYHKHGQIYAWHDERACRDFAGMPPDEFIALISTSHDIIVRERGGY